LFDFSPEADVAGWQIEDDGVMGGRSKGRFSLNEQGHAVFAGDVSLENDGGFSSLQWYFEPIDVEGYVTAQIRLKGDGKRYQFRVETDRAERHSYIYHFETSGHWETVRIPLKEMTPRFRGEDLDLPKYPAKKMGHIRFLIANSKAETFRLEIDEVVLTK
jgi:hypothetical protein